MKNFTTLIENSKQAVRYWWLLLIVGIALGLAAFWTYRRLSRPKKELQ